MVRLDLLEEEVRNSGLTRQAIATKLGLTPQGLAKKFKGESHFKVDEAQELAKILHLSDARRGEIFFASESD